MKPSSKCHLIVVGAQKAGTTWLHDTLEYQNEFWCPYDRQEIHFFDRYYGRGYREYENLYKGAKCNNITFDVTPDYLCHPLVPNRINSYKRISKRPIKIIAILRNPIERAISAYKMKFNRDSYKLPLSEALKVDTTLIEKSKYKNSLTKYKKNFDNKDVKIFIMEKVFGNIEKFLKEVRLFVGAEDELVNPYGSVRVNASSEGQSYYLTRLVSTAVRRLGLEKMVHKVKRSHWSRFLRRDRSGDKKPIVDDNGVQLLHEKLSHEAREVSDLIGRPDVLEAWNVP